MALSDDLRWEKSRYVACLNNVRNTATSLSNAISTLNTVISTQNSCYKVDDIGGGSKYLDHLLEKEKSIYSNIVQNVIPGIQDKISYLDYRIQDALQQEQLQQRNN